MIGELKQLTMKVKTQGTRHLLLARKQKGPPAEHLEGEIKRLNPRHRTLARKQQLTAMI